MEILKSFIVALLRAGLGLIPQPTWDGGNPIPGEWGRYLTRSFTYFQPSAVYSQALVGATDKADITTRTPAGRAEHSYPQSILQATFPNVTLALEISLNTESSSSISEAFKHTALNDSWVRFYCSVALGT